MKRIQLIVGFSLVVLVLFSALLFTQVWRSESDSSESPVVFTPTPSAPEVSSEKEIEGLSSPMARAALKQVLDGDVSPQVFPERAQVDLDGMNARLILDRRITDLGNGDVQRLFLINGGGSYPYHRIEELLRYDAGQGTYVVVRQSIMVADHFLVKLRAGVDKAELEKLNRRFGTRILEEQGFANKYIVQLSKPSLDDVFTVSALFAAETEVVERVHVNPIHFPSVIPNDTLWSSLWGKQRMDCPEAWDVETGDTNIIVAIIDTGVDLDHSDLAAHIWKNPGEAGALATNGQDDDGNGLVDDWIGWDFGQNDNDPDDNGDEDYDGTFSKGSHGTHCAGIVGAMGNNTNQVAGVCWNVTIMALKPFEYMGDPYFQMVTYASKAELAMEYATDNGAKITSNSYGGPGTEDSYYDGVNYQNSSGVLFIAASGNDGIDNDLTAYQPAGVDLPNVIVAANSTSSEVLSSSSNYGANTVDIVAPGSSICSTYPGDTTGYKSGTSMAAPQVAGAAALLFSYMPDLSYLDCKQALFNGVETFAAYSNKCVTHGRMNVRISLELLDGYSVKSPVASAAWKHQTTQTVQWATAETNGLSRITLRQNGSNVLTIAINVAKADQAYEWVVSDTLPAADNYRIRIEDMSDSMVFAESDLFHIGPWFPYSESFETGLGVWEQSAGDDFDWLQNSEGTLSSSTGPASAHHGTYYFYTESSDPNNPSKTANLEADLPFSLLDNPEVAFAYHMYGSAMGTLALEVSTNSGSSWNTEWSLSGDQGNQWFQTNVNLSAYAGAPVRLRFRGVTGSTFSSDMAIDSIAISNGTAELVTDLSEVNVPEGSTSQFQIKLSGVPLAIITVNVARVSGDTDIAVSSGASLEFTTGNWSDYQTVTLAASEDADWAASSAIIRCSSPDMSDVDVIATEVENDTNPALQLPFSETFENEGVNAGTLGPLDGQHGWTGGGTVQTGTAQSGTQALSLTGETAAHTFVGAPTNIWITLWAQPVPGAAPSTVASNAAAVFYVSTNDLLVAYSNEVPIEIIGATVSNGWNKIELFCDYISEEWNLEINNELVASNFGFYGSPASFSAIELAEESTNTFFIDSITVSDSSGEPDTDTDGIPDSWETLYFGGATNADANATCSNGVNTVLEAYVAGLNPTNPASVFVMTDLGDNAGDINETILRWNLVTNRLYTIYWTSNLLSEFTLLQSNITAGAFTDTVHGANNDGFYRIEIDLAP